MTSWMKERDLLVEQTQAFVQGVAAAHPIRMATPAVAPASSPVQVSASPAPRAVPPADAAPPAPPAPAAATRVSAAPAEAAAPARMRPLPSIASERAAIVARVSAFRAHQEKLNQEREAYYATVQAKIKDVLGNEF